MKSAFLGFLLAAGSVFGQDISARLYATGTNNTSASVGAGTAVTVDVVIQQTSGSALNVNSLQFGIVETGNSGFTFNGVSGVPGSDGAFTEGPFAPADLLVGPGSGDPIGTGSDSLTDPITAISFSNALDSPLDYSLANGVQYSILTLQIDTTGLAPGTYTFRITQTGVGPIAGDYATSSGDLYPGWLNSDSVAFGNIISGGDFTITITGGEPVPEPSTIVLLGGAAAMGAWRLRRRGKPVEVPAVV